jgi:hypothetical protein
MVVATPPERTAAHFKRVAQSVILCLKSRGLVLQSLHSVAQIGILLADRRDLPLPFLNARLPQARMTETSRVTPLSRSRPVVYKLATLFSLDAFANGGIVGALFTTALIETAPLAAPFLRPAKGRRNTMIVLLALYGRSSGPSSASAATCSNDPVQRHRFRHAFEVMGAAFPGDEQASDLTLHSRCDNDGTRLCQSLGSRRDVRHVAEYLARGVHHHRPRVDGNARREGWLGGALILAVLLGKRPLDRQRRPHCTLSIVLLTHRVTEQRHQSVAELLGDPAVHLRYCS